MQHIALIVTAMHRFRDLGIRKGHSPGKKFDELMSGQWYQRFESFAQDKEKTIALFRAAHERFLSAQPKLPQLERIPQAGVKAHIEFTLRSFAYGWKSDTDLREIVEEEYVTLLERSRKPLPPETNLMANTLYGADVVLGFLDSIKHASGKGKFLFFQEVATNGLFCDPLFLEFMLSRAESVEFDDDLARFSKQLSRRYSASVDQASLTFQTTDANYYQPSSEEAVAKAFEKIERPFDLGSRFVVYAVDGQIAPRMHMLPEEATATTAKSLASILIYGVVPGGLVGGAINHHEIHLGVDRADIDLLTIYPEFQAVVIAPIKRLVGSGFSYREISNTKVWYDCDRAVAKTFLLGPADGWLPYINPRDLVAIVPRKLERLLKEAIACLAEKLGLADSDLDRQQKQTILYDPAYWGNTHNFVEFLQLTDKGRQIIDNVLQ